DPSTIRRGHPPRLSILVGDSSRQCCCRRMSDNDSVYLFACCRDCDWRAHGVWRSLTVLLRRVAIRGNTKSISPRIQIRKGEFAVIAGRDDRAGWRDRSRRCSRTDDCCTWRRVYDASSTQYPTNGSRQSARPRRGRHLCSSDRLTIESIQNPAFDRAFYRLLCRQCQGQRENGESYQTSAKPKLTTLSFQSHPSIHLI